MIPARRTISILTVLLALLVATGWDACRPESRAPGTQLLRYVPADTALFAGITQEAWAHELGRGSGIYRYLLGSIDADPARAAARLGPAAGVVVALLRAQRSLAEEGGSPMAAHGVPPDAVMAAYTVGQNPVLRWQLTDPRRFWDSVDAAEQSAGISARTERREDLALRRYPLDLPAGPVELVLATGEGFALAALHAPDHEESSVDELLGIERPADPLDRAALDDLARSYGLVPGTVAFVDNERLLAPLSDYGAAALIARIARTVRDADIPLHSWLVEAGSAACRDALLLLPEYWSRTVFGMTDFEPGSRRVEQRLVFETPHQRGLAGLETLQGRIPALAQASETVLGVGIGVDFGAWLPDEPQDAVEAASASDEADASEAAEARSDCAPIAAFQSPGAADGPSAAERRLLAHAAGVGASVFRTPPAGGRGQRPGAASAVMVTTDEPDEVRAALQEIGALEPVPAAHRAEPVAPWRSVRRSNETAPGEGLLLSEAPLVLAQPPAGSAEAAATDALLTLRYRHGVSLHATVAALDPWLTPLPEAHRRIARQVIRYADRVPFDFDGKVRVGERGIELDLGVGHAGLPAGIGDEP